MINQELPYFNWPIYGLADTEKTKLLSKTLSSLTWHHFENCEIYSRILKSRGLTRKKPFALDQVPFIPVKLFKKYLISSVIPEKIFKIITSSGTSSDTVSRIVLDREMAKTQTKALVLILQQFLGKKRLPMLIIDHPGHIKKRNSFSARGAGILGLSNFGRDHTYVLSEKDMRIDSSLIHKFLDRHQGEKIFIFGFTFMVWKYFYQALKDSPNAPKFNECVLIHSGGWKKLKEEKVDNNEYKRELAKQFNINHIHNFYGMVEQVGSIFMECEYGHFHSPAYADVLIRDAIDWSVLPKGKIGLIQVISVLPTSYPGHSILTEDIGEWTGIDDCPCGRLGKTFHVHGRLESSELRGCSDIHASRISDYN
jgi:phenylacetate-coenzyme A ligase PaaK-like adenylate-forming protein